MKDETQIFLFASPDIQKLLIDNEIDLVELLQQEGIEASKEFAKDPATDANSGYKDVTAVILASAAFVLAITPIISKVIEALSHKKVLVKELVCIPVEDSNGDVVKNSYGQPIIQWVERTRLLEPSTKMNSNHEISLKGPVGFEITYSDSSTQALPNSDSLEV